MTNYLISGIEEDTKQTLPEIMIPEKFISDPSVRYWFIDKHFNAPIWCIYTSRLQNLFERIVDLLFTEAEEELLEEIFSAVPDLISKQTLRLKVYKYQIENDFFETTEERWFAEGQVQILEKVLYKSTVLMNLDPSNTVVPSESDLETNLEVSLATQFIDDLPTRPAREISRLTYDSISSNSNPNALSKGYEFSLPLPDKRSNEWYSEVLSDLKRYLDSLDYKLLDVSVIGILVKIMQYVVSGIDDFHVILSEKKVLDIMWPSISRAMMFDLESYFFGGDTKRGEELVEYLIGNLSELKDLFANTIGGSTRIAQINSYIDRFQREYLEHFQNRAREIQIQMWKDYEEKESLITALTEIKNEEIRSRLQESISNLNAGYGYSEVGITLVERHLRRLITAYRKGLFDDFCMRRNLEAILSISGFNDSSEMKDKGKFIQRVLGIINSSQDLSRFYSQLIEGGRAEERREVEI